MPLALAYLKLAHRKFKNRHQQKSQKNYHKNCTAAIYCFTRAREVDPNLAAESFYYCGVVYQAMDKAEEAIENYSRSIELNPIKPESYFNRAVLYQCLKRYPQATEDFLKFIQFCPNDASTYNNLGLILESLNEQQQAFDKYCDAISVDPTNPVFYCNRGSIYQTRKEYEAAANDFTAAIKLYENCIDSPASKISNPNDHQDFYLTQERDRIELIKDSYQKIQMHLGKPQQSTTTLEQLALVYFKRSVTHYHLGNRTAAINDFESAVKLDPTFEDAYINVNEIPLTKKKKVLTVDSGRYFSDTSKSADLQTTNEENLLKKLKLR